MVELPISNSDRKTIVDEETVLLLEEYKIRSIVINNCGALFGFSRKLSEMFSISRLILNVKDSWIYVDHINRDKLDNRKCNLRLCSPSQNNANGKLKQNGNRNTSKYRGVSWDKHAKKWVARIALNHKEKYLGLFIDEEGAARAYDKAAKEIHKEFATLNFPDETYPIK